MSHLEDASDQRAEHNDAMAAEAYDRDQWDYDTGPSREEIEREEFDNWRWIRAQGDRR